MHLTKNTHLGRDLFFPVQTKGLKTHFFLLKLKASSLLYLCVCVCVCVCVCTCVFAGGGINYEEPFWRAVFQPCP